MHQGLLKTIIIREIILKIEEENKTREIAVVEVLYGAVPIEAVLR